MRKVPIILILSLFLFVVLSGTVFAVSWLPIVPCGTSANPAECTRCDLFKLFKNIIDFVLYGLMPPVAAILFVWGGFLILMGGANPGWISQGRTIFWNTFMGVVIISASWLMTNTVIKSLGEESVVNPNTPWYQFECRGGVVASPSPTSTPTPTGSPTPTPTGSVTPTPTGSVTPTPTGSPTPTPTVSVCSFMDMNQDTNLCQPRSMTCGAPSCGTHVTTINQYAERTGMPNGANLLKAIMIKESSCNALADSGHAYGIMQIKPSTANVYKAPCGVTANIDAQWLKDNPSLSICIAAEYIKALSQTACGNTVRGVAAGYNGGAGACGNSNDCSGQNSCAGGPVKKWECWYDNPQQTVCNEGYNETRDYATKVLFCYNNPGF